jgi:hypothetical protein
MGAMKSKCSIEGCVKPPYGRGWCGSHYKRWLRHGDPFAGRSFVGEAHKFLDSACANNGSGCLKWPYARSENGYGNISIDGRNHVVSRVVCERVNGSPPTSEHEAAHSCGRGHEGCISPAHLRWALPVENQLDRYIHGTDGVGSSNAAAKLAESSVSDIIAAKGEMTQESLAAQYGVSPSTIGQIHRGVTWQHVGP